MKCHIKDIWTIDLIKKYSALLIFFLGLFAENNAFAKSSTPTAIIGGQGDAPYAAFIEYDGSLTSINGLP